MLCKLRATGPNFLDVIYIKWHFLPLYQILCHSDQRFLRYKVRKFGEFPSYCIAKWPEGHKLSSNTWLPPYKPEEILRSLNGHNFNISKFINLKFWEDI